MEKRFTIEFAGIIALMWGKERAEAWHVDVSRAVGAKEHCPTLLIPDHDGLGGAKPDAIVALPGGVGEAGVWHLSGWEVHVEVVGVKESLKISSKGKMTDRPRKKRDLSAFWRTIKRLPDLKLLSNATSLNTRPPLLGRVLIERGEVQGVMPPTKELQQARYNFQDPDDNGCDLFDHLLHLAGRFQWSFTMGRETAIVLTRSNGAEKRRIVLGTVPPYSRAVISSGCVGHEELNRSRWRPEGHYMAYYKTLQDPDRAPILYEVTPLDWPDYVRCGNFQFQVDEW